MKKIILVLSVLLALVGCSSKNPSTQEFNNAPKWVRIPRVKGYITGLGTAEPNKGNDLSLQRSEAMAMARNDIASQIETKIGSFTNRFAETTGSGKTGAFARDVKTKTRNVIKMKLRGARTKNSWMSESGKLYLLMTLETKEVLNMIKQSIPSNLKNKDIQYQRFLSEKNQKELEKELENYEK